MNVMSNDPIHYRETKYGFEYGAASVERTASHKGHILMLIKTPYRWLEVRVTPKGQNIETTQFDAPKD
jgi:hypothetical protein